jgi:predicted KAP-like P-loop ATPase
MFSEKLKVHADKPIDLAQSDQFRRANFVRSLSDVISQSASTNGSIALALTGPWGSGKTSLRNLVKEYLASKYNPPSVMEFLPWQLSGTGKITPLFFEALINQMSKEKVFKNSKEHERS